MENRLTQQATKNLSQAQERKLMFQSIQDQQLNGRVITLDGEEKINFSSYSYLGLELDSRLKDAAIKAIQQYGTQLPCSRAYLSLGLYQELEELLAQIYGKPVLVAASTTLCHIAAIPVLVGEKDLVILDFQVHNSVQGAVKALQAEEIEVELMSHNDMQRLEKRLERAKEKYDRIWYFADGVYSIFGDGLAHPDLQKLLNKFDNFYMYIDDAHGNGWEGEHGKGFALSKIAPHERVIISTSLNKSFAAGGGALICHDEEMKQHIFKNGSTMLFSGPISTPMLGAAVASAKIHLSNEIYDLQDELKNKIHLFYQVARQHKLPIVDESLTPIFFIAIGDFKAGLDICNRMSQQGYYCPISAFPSVPMNNTGIRITITCHLTHDDIKKMLACLGIIYKQVITERGLNIDDIYHVFNIPVLTNTVG